MKQLSESILDDDFLGNHAKEWKAVAQIKRLLKKANSTWDKTFGSWMLDDPEGLYEDIHKYIVQAGKEIKRPENIIKGRDIHIDNSVANEAGNTYVIFRPGKYGGVYVLYIPKNYMDLSWKGCLQLAFLTIHHYYPGKPPAFRYRYSHIGPSHINEWKRYGDEWYRLDDDGALIEAFIDIYGE